MAGAVDAVDAADGVGPLEILHRGEGDGLVGGAVPDVDGDVRGDVEPFAAAAEGGGVKEGALAVVGDTGEDGVLDLLRMALDVGTFGGRKPRSLPGLPF